MYARRGSARAVVHLHSTYSVAASVLADLPPEDVLPPLTAYYVMRIGKLPLVPYFAPGDPELAAAVAARAGEHHALLLSNHGPVIAGTSLTDAQYAIEELEETAKLFLLLRGSKLRLLEPDQVRQLRERYPHPEQ
jgi:ribulose-5-phosphate 4-epimerase/fuculose-1-phosphate aldolase